MKEQTFGIIGGDLRQIYLMEALLRAGKTVCAYGFEQTNLVPEGCRAGLEALQDCSVMVLPLPVTADQKTVFAPFARDPIAMDASLLRLLQGKRIFCGQKQRLAGMGEPWASLPSVDYAAQESFAVQNAVPTAEGAIALAVEESPGNLNGSKALVCGFGRIGKVLSRMLHGLGAKVTVAARKPSDLAWISLLGYTPCQTGQWHALQPQDFVFNTIPFLVLDENALRRVASHALVIDLASLPGGVDFEAAKRLNIPARHALALPGKMAPKAAGEAIYHTMEQLLEEETQ